ncbi:GGDEF domain-containing protein [Rhizobiaceae bacterium n13]|uniref:diguanylate cyclase n=1 Tax=Ferirhizobium litorale TaxID=2927786 RepID=A0AAE3QFC0_9HYPH|nr:GGDEF domain-containing protein [Fererhizobium litorale]MDI7863286.1 GGDEF domain-containing protein [Fererhizobium litorale]MDI7922980.1 GGDEF domain-containing protein [Fererhizobium litorale]
MGGAFPLLAVNFAIAIIFAFLFLAIARRSPSRWAAVLFGAGYAVASLAAICEALVAVTCYTRFFAVGAYASMLGGLCLLTIGVGEFYRLSVSRWLVGALFFAGVAVDMLIFDLPRGAPAHAVPYQIPFILVQALAAWVVLRAARRSTADKVLLALLLLTAIYFLGKAIVAVLSGNAFEVQSYLNSNYALLSQGLGAILIVGTGLALVGVLVREMIDNAVATSDVDPLSGLLNRRGFERRVLPLLRTGRSDAGGALILADLDYFKRINDNFGHQAGDEVIQAFARLLQRSVPKEAAVARMGGEEFAVYLPGTDADAGRMFATGIRVAMASRGMGKLQAGERITASFGVAQFAAGEALDAVMRRADVALYAAKAAGRDQVTVAEPQVAVHPQDCSAQVLQMHSYSRRLEKK